MQVGCAGRNIAQALARLAQQGGSVLTGVICNSRGKPDFERAVLGEFAVRLGTELVGRSMSVGVGRLPYEHNPLDHLMC
jgi:nitrogenase subunit NifH